MPYSQSIPRAAWLDRRRENINVLATAHAQLGEVEGPGRPREIGRPVAHAYVLRAVAEFQAFVRDLHDLGAEKLVELAQPQPQYRPLLTAAATEGRLVDRGNADLRSIRQDFRRLGLTEFSSKMGARDRYWDSDQARYQDLIELRNALAHGNQGQLERLRSRGVVDTVTWARDRLPGLDRIAHALDRVVWDHLHGTLGADPW